MTVRFVLEHSINTIESLLWLVAFLMLGVLPVIQDVTYGVKGYCWHNKDRMGHKE